MISFGSIIKKSEIKKPQFVFNSHFGSIASKQANKYR